MCVRCVCVCKRERGGPCVCGVCVCVKEREGVGDRKRDQQTKKGFFRIERNWIEGQFQGSENLVGQN